MPVIVCNDCGTPNELPTTLQLGAGGEAFFYCRGCANPVSVSSTDSADVSGAGVPESPEGGSGDLLDELLGLPVTHKPSRTNKSQPPPAAVAEVASPSENGGPPIAAPVPTNGVTDATDFASHEAPSPLTTPDAAASAAFLGGVAENPWTEAVAPEQALEAPPFQASKDAETAMLGESTVLVEPAVLAEAIRKPVPPAGSSSVSALTPPDGVTPLVPAAMAPPRLAPSIAPSVLAESPAPEPAFSVDDWTSATTPTEPTLPTEALRPFSDLQPAAAAAGVAPTPIEEPSGAIDAASDPSLVPSTEAAGYAENPVEELSWDVPSVVALPALAHGSTESAPVKGAPIVPLAQPSPVLQASIEAAAAAMRAARGTPVASGETWTAAEPARSTSLPAPGRSMQPTLPFDLSMPVTTRERKSQPEARAAAIAGSVSSASGLDADAVLPRSVESSLVPEPPEGSWAEPRAAEPVALTRASREWPFANARSPERAGQGEPLASSKPARSYADSAPSFSLPAFQSNRLKRFAPHGAVLFTIALAFVVGHRMGKMSPSGASGASAPSAPSAAAVSAPRTVARSPEPLPTAAPPAPAPPAPDPDSSPDIPEAPSESAPARPTAAHGSAPKANFNAKTAAQVIGQATARAKACKKPGNPGGAAVATVTFAASGRVEEVAISGARIAGTPMAACIAATLRSARVAPFSGQPQTLKKAFKI